MPEENETSEVRSKPNPRRKESDQAILDVFTQSSDKFLTTREVAEQLDIGKRQTGTRLNQLEEASKLESKAAGGGRIWWLSEDVDRSSMVASAMLRLVFSRMDVQFGLIGLILGLTGGLGMVLFLGLSVTETTFPLLTEQNALLLGFYGIVLSMSFLVVAIVTYLFQRGMGYFKEDSQS
jgi:hypothetical protein